MNKLVYVRYRLVLIKGCISIGSPLYVGVGNEGRANHIRRNVFFNRTIAKVKLELKLPKDHPGYHQVIVAKGLTIEQAFELEVELIAKYGRLDIKTGTLANFTSGGDGCCHLSPEAIERIRQGNRLKKISEGQKASISEHNRTRHWSVSSRQKIGHSNKTRVWRPESLAKMKGRKWSSTQRAVLSLSWVGKKHSPETLTKMRASQAIRRQKEKQLCN